MSDEPGDAKKVILRIGMARGVIVHEVLTPELSIEDVIESVQVEIVGQRRFLLHWGVTPIEPPVPAGDTDNGGEG